jgi:hypothetical protein
VAGLLMNYDTTDAGTERAESIINYMNYATKINENKIIRLNDANEYLQNGRDEYQIFDSIPIRIINNEAYIILLRRAD